jgi:hypothetical protein
VELEDEVEVEVLVGLDSLVEDLEVSFDELSDDEDADSDDEVLARESVR